ncbi:MAG: formate acetyltransferase [Desulfobacterales bacterium]|nr:formate acetyltransferase [Desulfobacterales bacterium]
MASTTISASFTSCQDLSLREITLDSLPRLKRLRDLHFGTKPEICLELPRLMTYYMKNSGNKEDSPELRAGKMYKYILENKKPVIIDDNLLAGTTTTKQVGVVLYPHLLAQSIWPELETVSRRKKNPFGITREEIDELNFEIFPYWMNRTIQEVARKENGNPFCQRLMERVVFFIATKVYCISHTVPNYAAVVERGLLDIINEAKEKELSLGNSSDDKEKRDFYQAVQLSLNGILSYAANLSRLAASMAQKENDPVRKEELLRMSEVCSKVPAQKPTTFSEALNAVWICRVALLQENSSIAMSPGRLDQVLYPLYRRDMERGMSLSDAVELVGCLWLKICDQVPLAPEVSEELFGGSGCNQAITLGGIDMEGKDAVNDLTYVMLRATELLKVRDPNVNARYHPEVNQKEYLHRLCEVNINTGATPCFHNDRSAIEALQGQGVSLEHARDYSSVGCVEPTSSGRTFGHTGCILMNLPSALELAFFQGKHRLTEDEPIGPETKAPKDITSFEEFKEVLATQLAWLIDQAVTLNNNFGRAYQKIHPSPMQSALMEGCMQKGKDVIQGGALYNSSGAAMIGIAEVVDCMTAIEEFVFKKEAVSFSELLEAINKNWEGYEKLQAMVKTSTEKFGADSEMAKKNADWLIGFLHNTFQGKENYRGGKYTVGYWTMTNHAGFGVLSGALPSGRKKGEPFPSGITPVSGSAPVLTACLSFVAHLDHTHIADGHALNLKYTPSTTTSPKFAHTIEAFFKMGGLQVQFNIIDRKTFEDARKHPEKYPDLFVRVSGYSAYFKDLNPQMQQEIITRAEYHLDTGKEVRY